MDIAIEVKDLQKRYSRTLKPAIQDLNLVVGRAQLFGLVGPDGAGKTTVLRMLASVMEPSSGSARVAGYDIVKQAEFDPRTDRLYAPEFQPLSRSERR